MSKYVKLTPAQKDEIRRLTQLANRRIKAAERAYSKAGKRVLPREIAGHHQTKESWATKNTPISRSVRFISEKEYRKQLHYLRSFEVIKPGIKEYTEIQRDKTTMGLQKSIGANISEEIKDKLGKMTAPELAEFWRVFSNKSSKLGMKYSSTAAMIETMYELFPEDMVSAIPA